MAAEQFGTNLRATAATTIPNMVRGALPLINFLFLDILQKTKGWNIVQSGIFTGATVMIITLLAFVFTEETYHKDLDYLENIKNDKTYVLNKPLYTLTNPEPIKIELGGFEELPGYTFYSQMDSFGSDIGYFGNKSKFLWRKDSAKYHKNHRQLKHRLSIQNF